MRNGWSSKINGASSKQCSSTNPLNPRYARKCPFEFRKEGACSRVALQGQVFQDNKMSESPVDAGTVLGDSFELQHLIFDTDDQRQNPQ